MAGGLVHLQTSQKALLLEVLDEAGLIGYFSSSLTKPIFYPPL